MTAMLVYMTTGEREEARTIGQALVQERLAACVNMIEPMTSIYRWEGKIQEDKEVVLLAKTTSEQLADLIEKVKSLHSYACPCIVAVPIQGGNPAFLQWIAVETAPDG
ncbi:Divalent-cation tolerance protein CutA [Planctomycetes bacterium Pan216]|uniref:Divalent-cation tolerance protein CutA n=1 Tax=Kolteria novifilia TaxID=2527975 RepID=A0A518B844_9BACT|nr:Divalent-cation tolerance protein CutA [Planctomycetes bacterium Pan216]